MLSQVLASVLGAFRQVLDQAFGSSDRRVVDFLTQSKELRIELLDLVSEALVRRRLVVSLEPGDLVSGLLKHSLGVRCECCLVCGGVLGHVSLFWLWWVNSEKSGAEGEADDDCEQDRSEPDELVVWYHDVSVDELLVSFIMRPLKVTLETILGVSFMI